VLTCSARELTGIEEIWAVCPETPGHHDLKLRAGAEPQSQSLSWMWSLVEEGLKDRFHITRKFAAPAPTVAAGGKWDVVAGQRGLSIAFFA